MKNNKLWKFLISVKLALINFMVLASVSIVGTIIQQNKEHGHYLELWGRKLSNLIFMLGLDDMFNTWWYMTLLGIFGLNLLLCTIDRLPHAFIMATKKPAAENLDQLRKRRIAAECVIAADSLSQTAARIAEYLGKKGWRDISRRQEGAGSGNLVVCCQKGGWSRLGVYVVHIGILIVMIGAVWGGVLGFKTSVMIPEGPLVEGQRENAPVPLSFEIRCDWFSIDYYETGAVRQYQSRMTLLKDGQEVLQKILKVNDPITFAGITLYQDSYKAMDDQYSLAVKNLANGIEKVFQIRPHQQNQWPEEGLVFGIAKTSVPFKNDNDGHNHGPRDDYRHQVAFAGADGQAELFWISENQPAVIEILDNRYSVLIKQRYYTGLQVVKDPGVLIVYLGFLLMLTGLYAVYFHAHRRLWIFISKENTSVRLTFRGTANKNSETYQLFLSKMANDIQSYCKRG